MREHTTTISLGPLSLPLTAPAEHAVSRFIRAAESKGYAVRRAEQDGRVTVHATKTAPLEQPYTRVAQASEARA
jgi:hypothetical protein